MTAKKLRVFVSWSTEPSREIAEAFQILLRKCVQSAEGWVSSRDIRPFSVWSQELDDQLAELVLGVLVITQDNLTAPWMLYEAGALANRATGGIGGITCLLVDVRPTNVPQPLGRFQNVPVSREGVFELLLRIGELAPYPVVADDLSTMLEAHWAAFAAAVDAARPKIGKPAADGERSERAVLEEILTLVRDTSARPSRWVEILGRGPGIAGFGGEADAERDLADTRALWEAFRRTYESAVERRLAERATAVERSERVE